MRRRRDSLREGRGDPSPHPALATAVFLCAVTGFACRGGLGVPPRPSLLLVTLDTTRADRLGCYGHNSAATPRLDRLAAEGCLAEHAIAVAPLTLPSHASILTGLYPPRHGVRDNGDYRLGISETTLAEHLRAQGYFTAASVGSLVLAAAQGLDQGFDAYDEPKTGALPISRTTTMGYRTIVERRASEVTDAALQALKGSNGRPFFLWVHYFDPHSEYEPPSPWRERFAASPYDGEIAYTDAEIGRLLDGLDRLRGLSDLVIAVIGDHGESLGEHGEATHGMLLYESTLRVPLLLWGQGRVARGARIREPVSGVDLAPTLLDLLGASPMRGIAGTSFAGVVRGEGQPARRVLYSESVYGERAFGWAPLAALREGPRKFVEAPEPELFDLETDPEEARNLAATSPDEVRARRSMLREILVEMGAPEPDPRGPVGEDRRALLESLGYVSSGGAGTGRLDRPDPKRLVAVSEAYLEAKHLVSAGDLLRAAERLREVLAADPGNPAALALEGAIEFSLGNRERGISLLEKAARSAPGVFEHRRNLADACHAAGRLDESEAEWRAALGIQPGSAEAHFALGNVLFAKGDDRGAAASYRESLRFDPRSPKAHAALGVVLERWGEIDSAERHYREATEAEPEFFEAWNRLGVLLEKGDRLGDARAAYERGLAVRPEDPGLLFNHAKACLRLLDLAAARESGERLLAVDSGHPVARFLLARVLVESGDSAGARDLLREFLLQPEADPRLLSDAREQLGRLGS